ncbi:hypothetical protein H5410_048819 [Solanum commersonii]|uniref:S-protein homolog n=1 Tax=Solanum commersonii TaxID=4109 RepID=A0A9J5XJ92_SOLCO|nr:hypothetical protein H5410_048819 [Solanum commersonii]
MPYNIRGCSPSFDIHNDLPQNTPQLKFHCASGDDDLGYHYPAIGSDFHWSFCATPATLFFCHFWWNEKDLAFDVYNQITGCVTDGSVPDYVVNCHWQVKADGYCEEKHEVHVHNDLHQNIPQLEVHCASGDDELGYRYPEIGT